MIKSGILLILLIALSCFSSCHLKEKQSRTSLLKDGVIEASEGKFLVKEDLQIIEIMNAEGFTMWYKKLTGKYTIS